eukprot:3682566-Rhodomonas_salina.1
MEPIVQYVGLDMEFMSKLLWNVAEGLPPVLPDTLEGRNVTLYNFIRTYGEAAFPLAVRMTGQPPKKRNVGGYMELADFLVLYNKVFQLLPLLQTILDRVYGKNLKERMKQVIATRALARLPVDVRRTIGQDVMKTDPQYYLPNAFDWKTRGEKGGDTLNENTRSGRTGGVAAFSSGRLCADCSRMSLWGQSYHFQHR